MFRNQVKKIRIPRTLHIAFNKIDFCSTHSTYFVMVTKLTTKQSKNLAFLNILHFFIQDTLKFLKLKIYIK